MAVAMIICVIASCTKTAQPQPKLAATKSPEALPETQPDLSAAARADEELQRKLTDSERERAKKLAKEEDEKREREERLLLMTAKEKERLEHITKCLDEKRYSDIRIADIEFGFAGYGSLFLRQRLLDEAQHNTFSFDDERLLQVGLTPSERLRCLSIGSNYHFRVWTIRKSLLGGNKPSDSAIEEYRNDPFVRDLLIHVLKNPVAN